MDKWIGGGLQVIGAFLIFAAGVSAAGHGTPPAPLLFLGGAGCSVASLRLFYRAWRTPLPPREEPRPLPQSSPAPTLDDHSRRMEEILLGLQADVAQLREERGFLYQLYGHKPGPVSGEPPAS